MGSGYHRPNPLYLQPAENYWMWAACLSSVGIGPARRVPFLRLPLYWGGFEWRHEENQPFWESTNRRHPYEIAIRCKPPRTSDSGMTGVKLRVRHIEERVLLPVLVHLYVLVAFRRLQSAEVPADAFFWWSDAHLSRCGRLAPYKSIPSLVIGRPDFRPRHFRGHRIFPLQKLPIDWWCSSCRFHQGKW